mgnify:CR=1 FL=1
MPTRLSPRLLPVLLLALAAALPGCGMTVRQHAAVRKFSASTVALCDLAAQHFTESRAQVVAVNLRRARLGDPAIDVSPNAPVEANDAALAGLIQARHLTARLVALSALRVYANLLTALAGDAAEDELRVAVDGLLGSLQRADAFELGAERRASVTGIVTLALRRNSSRSRSYMIPRGWP